MNLRTANELINTKEPAWELVRNWINTAKNVVEVLPLYLIKDRETLYKVQVTKLTALRFNQKARKQLGLD